jgi:hypothetical protein
VRAHDDAVLHALVQLVLGARWTRKRQPQLRKRVVKAMVKMGGYLRCP